MPVSQKDPSWLKFMSLPKKTQIKLHAKPKLEIPDPVVLTKDFYHKIDKTIKREDHPLENQVQVDNIDKIMLGDSTINPNYSALHQYKQEKNLIRRESKLSYFSYFVKDCN